MNFLTGAIIQLVVISGILVLLACLEGFRYRDWARKYPIISDEEFMAKLPPDTDREVALKVRTIVAEQCGVDRERVHPETKLEDLFE